MKSPWKVYRVQDWYEGHWRAFLQKPTCQVLPCILVPLQRPRSSSVGQPVNLSSSASLVKERTPALLQVSAALNLFKLSCNELPQKCFHFWGPLRDVGCAFLKFRAPPWNIRALWSGTSIDCIPGRKIFWEETPLTSCSCHIENSVQDFTARIFWGSTTQGIRFHKIG